MKLKNLIVAVDFDGTCVTHAYPGIGRDIGAIPVLRRMVEAGAKLILYTMRSGDELEAAVQWFADAGIRLYAVGINPGQRRWTASNKCYAQLYIDDAALGCPLVMPEFDHERPYVDWKRVEAMLF